MEPDALDRSRRYRTAEWHLFAAVPTTAFRLHGNKDCGSSPPGVATHRTKSMYRYRCETVSLPSTAVSLCPLTNTRTTALQYCAENRQTCRCQMEFLPR